MVPMSAPEGGSTVKETDWHWRPSTFRTPPTTLPFPPPPCGRVSCSPRRRRGSSTPIDPGARVRESPKAVARAHRCAPEQRGAERGIQRRDRCRQPRLVPGGAYVPAWSCAGKHSQLAALIDIIRSKSWTSWPARVQALSCRRNMYVDMKDEDGRNDMSAVRPTVPLGTTVKAITRVGFGACAVGEWAFGWGGQDDLR